MAEAFGLVCIKVPENMQTDFIGNEDVPTNAMRHLFDHCGIPNMEKSHQMLSFGVREQDFAHEGISVHEGFVCINIFGDTWMHAMEALAKKGSGVELYGKIEHEYGHESFYVLTSDNTRYFENIDYEGDINVENEQEIYKTWLAYVPQTLVDQHSDFFTVPEPEDEEEKTYEFEKPVPVKDSDYLCEYSELCTINEDLLYPEMYKKEYLVDAKKLGAGLVSSLKNASFDVQICMLHKTLTNPEISGEEKTTIALDMLDIFEVDVNAAYGGYGDVFLGTPIFLATKGYLHQVVAKLLSMGADPHREEGNFPKKSATDEIMDAVMYGYDQREEYNQDHVNMQKTLALLEPYIDLSE